MEENDVVIVNKREYYMLKEMEDFKSKFEREYIEKMDLKSENEKLKEQLQKEKDNKLHKIQFETYLAVQNPSFYNPNYYSQEKKWIEKKHDIINSFQFRVDTGIVGYEREYIFDSLKEVGERVVKDVLEKIDEKYNESVKKHMIEYTNFHKDYDELREKVKKFNETHIFHKIDI